MKKRIRIALFTILLCVLCGCSNASVLNHTTNQTQNTAADRPETKEIRGPGLITKVNDKIYFSNYDKQKSTYSVIESNLDGSDPKTIFTDDAMFDGLFTVDDHTLCIRYLLPAYSEVYNFDYYFLDLKSKVKTPLFQEEGMGWNIVYDGNWFYYITTAKDKSEELCYDLYKMKINSAGVPLKKNMEDFDFITKDKIYYVMNDVLYQMNLDGENSEKVVDVPGNLFSFQIYKNQMFYDLYNDQMTRSAVFKDNLFIFDLISKNKVTVPGIYEPAVFCDTAFYAVEKILIIDEGPFGVYDRYLTKISYDGKHIKRLTKIGTENISFIDDWIYFEQINEKGTAQIYRIHKDGGNPQLIADGGVIWGQ